jgi:DHA1 family bicyclomycin/chloramphenicol resistance-like MFS transporter
MSSLTELQRSPLFLFSLVAITAIGPLSMQIFLPALPAIQHDFAAAPGVVQLALSLSMVSIALATLAYGPLSDRYGRRPVVIAGLGLFLVGTAVCALAPDVPTLIVGRILQAAGGSSGMVLARAIVRDVYPGAQVASAIAYLTMAMVVAPMVAPAAGGVLTDLLGWRANFVFAGLVGVAVAALMVSRLPETNQSPSRLQGVVGMVLGFARLLRAPLFCGYVFQAAFSTGAFFAFAAGAPYVMVDVLGRPATEYGLYFILLGLAYILGNYLSARLSGRHGIHRMLVVGSALAFAATGFLATLVLVLPWSAPLIFGPTVLIGVANGLTMPNAQAGAVSYAPRAAGTASGLSGFLQMLLASVFAQIVGSLQDGTPYPMIGFMVLGSALSLASISLALWLGRRPASA